ncbi:MAG: hypothetical protein OXE86_02910 [Alphaproteobacteria bacterium]|nr:hypothetical protein [Alphaproteobacteria bacterium]
MSLVESGVGERPEAYSLVRGDGTGFVADPDADVVHLLELKHFVGALAWRAALREG